MVRRIRILLALLAVTFALSTAACSDSTAPQPSQGNCDWNSPWTC